MTKKAEIIEAVPQSLQKEYNKTMKRLYVTLGGMAATTGLFFTGIAIDSPYAGCFGMLWFYSLVGGSGYAYFKLKTKERILEQIDKFKIKATYTVGDTVEELAPNKGRNRLLRLIPSGLKTGIPFYKRFK